MMAEKALEENVSIAVLLRQARKERNLSLEDIAKEICVRTAFLQAIETSDFPALPGQTFAIGFVRSYAKIVGLDAQLVVDRFKAELLSAAEQTQAMTTIPAIDSTYTDTAHVKNNRTPEKPAYNNAVTTRHRWPAWLAPLAGLVGATASWVFISAQMTTATWYAGDAPSTIDVEVQQLAAIQARYIDKTEKRLFLAPNAAQAPFDQSLDQSLDQPEGGDILHYSATARGSLFMSSANAAPSTADAAGVDTLTLRAVEDSWVQLAYADGSALWSGVLRAGQEYTPRLSEDIFLTTSNAGGMHIRNGARISDPLGGRGVVVRALALNLSLVPETVAASTVHSQ